MNIRKFLYTENKISATLIDGYYLWIAHERAHGICHLLKQSAFDPSINYFTLNFSANRINQMWQDTSYLYLALDDDTNIACKLNKTSPLTTQTYFVKPLGTNGEAIDLITDNSNAYFLIAGVLSGTDAQIIKMSLSGTLVTTIDLPGIYNANKIDIDSTGTLWVVTNTSPVKLVGVHLSGGVYTQTVYTLV
jgi:hypothetical protein